MSRETKRERRSGRSIGLVVRVVVTLCLFLVAIRLLGAATDALRPVLRRTLRSVVVGNPSALGLSWFASYVLANGSVVAALSLSLFDSGLVGPSHLYLMIVGSRLGGAAVVVFVGAADYLNEEIESVRDSMRLGLLTFLLTHSIYLPVLALGSVFVPLVDRPDTGGGEVTGPEPNVPDVVSTLADTAVVHLGPGVAFLGALALIFVSLRLFDGILDSLDKERLRRRYITRLNDKWVSFGLGVLVTGLTTSVAFSLGVVVPLYNRGHIKRTEIMPFVLGANVGTLVDTLLVAVALDSQVGVRIVLAVLAAGTIVSLLALLWYPRYSALVEAVQTEIVDRPAYFAAFLLSLLLAPLGLLVVR
ncbi:sodium:phosphate symporter [Halosimplex litoreum]|uniref:Sodium:phosphate symporter n=1 Tax=Halosimplex litoreum TaxID=1198301 RepID=A0A7T3G0G8_9EURY|nr:sodium:phosphate symporter [Halosimplex litoreum]QPV63967.1 sodium:phosphate symporter [Halosimplex litoreum]